MSKDIEDSGEPDGTKPPEKPDDMAKLTVDIYKPLAERAQAMIKTGLWEDMNEFVADAMRLMLRHYPGAMAQARKEGFLPE